MATTDLNLLNLAEGDEVKFGSNRYVTPIQGGDTPTPPPFLPVTPEGNPDYGLADLTTRYLNNPGTNRVPGDGDQYFTLGNYAYSKDEYVLVGGRAVPKSLFQSNPGAYWGGMPNQPTPPSQSDLLAQEQKNIQANVDALNKYYDDLAQQEREKGLVREAQTRGINVRSGLAGSDFAASAADTARKDTARAVGSVNAERADRIQALLDKAYERSKTDYQFERQMANSDAETQIKLRAERKQQAQDELKMFAEARAPFEAFKRSAVYAQYQKELGFSDLEMADFYESQLKQAEKPEWGFEGQISKNGEAYYRQVGIDPLTGKKIEREYPLGVPFDQIAEKKLHIVNGHVLMESIDDNGNFILKELADVSEPTAAERMNKDSGVAVETAQVELDKVLGKDGFVSLVDYRRLKTQYLGTVGSSKSNADTFDSAFSSYLSPENRNAYGISPVKGGDSGSALSDDQFVETIVTRTGITEEEARKGISYYRSLISSGLSPEDALTSAAELAKDTQFRDAPVKSPTTKQTSGGGLGLPSIRTWNPFGSYRETIKP